MMFRLVTVTREYGSGGSVIAKTVAERLRWKVLDQSLISAVSRAAQVDLRAVGQYDEHVDSWWHRFNRGGLQAAAIEAGVARSDAQFFDAEAVAEFTQQEILRAAEKGNCVIVGRGAQCVLQDREDVFHVFIYGPLNERISRVQHRVDSTDDIEHLIWLTDHERGRYIRTYFGHDWKDPHLYNMMISSQMGIESAAAMIIDAVQRDQCLPQRLFA